MVRTSDDYERSAYNGRDNLCGDGGQAPAATFGTRTNPTFMAPGSVQTFTVRMRVAHKGRFEFRICQYSGAENSGTLTQGCFNQRVLQPVAGQPRTVVSGQQTPWYWVGDKSGINFEEFSMQYRIPSDLSCDGVSSFCVLQYTYVTGNSCNPSGLCPAGVWPAVCAPANWFPACTTSPSNGEHFRNCADIRVRGGGGSSNPPTTPGGPDLPVAPPGGQCGAAARAKCPSGQCCSQYGWCGVTGGHCSGGCQRTYGNCW